MLLAEELLLLAYDDDTGRKDGASNLDYALAGAILIELADQAKVEIDGEGRKTRLAVRDSTPSGHPVLDEWLAKVEKLDGRKPKDAVWKLHSGLAARLLEGLAERGILRKERDKVLGLFPTTRWPAQDSSHEEDLRRRLHAALVEGAQPEPRTAAVIALLHAISDISRHVEKADRKAAKQRAKEISESNWASDATRKAVEEMTAVVVAVTTMVVVAAGAGG